MWLVHAEIYLIYFDFLNIFINYCLGKNQKF